MTAGGYRAPSNPNVVSGPGKYSKRTDGGAAQVLSAAPDQPYGDVKQQLDSQRMSPMAGQEPIGEGQPQSIQMPAFAGPGFAEPSMRPDVPITHGVDIGPGAGPEALQLPQASPDGATLARGVLTNDLANLAARDSTGVLGRLYQQASIFGV